MSEKVNGAKKESPISSLERLEVAELPVNRRTEHTSIFKLSSSVHSHAGPNNKYIESGDIVVKPVDFINTLKGRRTKEFRFEADKKTSRSQSESKHHTAISPRYIPENMKQTLTNKLNEKKVENVVRLDVLKTGNEARDARNSYSKVKL